MVGIRLQNILFGYFAAAAVTLVFFRVSPGQFLVYAIGIFLVIVMIVAVVGMLGGRIRTSGLLRDKATGKFSGSRMQLLVVTVLGAAFYAGEILQTMPAGATLPAPPDWLLAAVGASNGGYLGTKIYAHVFRGLGQIADG